jgi:hypothetical protein
MTMFKQGVKPTIDPVAAPINYEVLSTAVFEAESWSQESAAPTTSKIRKLGHLLLSYIGMGPGYVNKVAARYDRDYCFDSIIPPGLLTNQELFDAGIVLLEPADSGPEVCEEPIDLVQEAAGADIIPIQGARPQNHFSDWVLARNKAGLPERKSRKPRTAALWAGALAVTAAVTSFVGVSIASNTPDSASRIQFAQSLKPAPNTTVATPVVIAPKVETLAPIVVVDTKQTVDSAAKVPAETGAIKSAAINNIPVSQWPYAVAEQALGVLGQDTNPTDLLLPALTSFNAANDTNLVLVDIGSNDLRIFFGDSGRMINPETMKQLNEQIIADAVQTALGQ